jgi:hypothetical protein
MDSDGNVGGKKGGRAEFTNTNRLLSEGVLELALSLGGRGRITKKVRGIEKVMGKMTQLKDTWHVNFATPDNPFGMTRKADRYSSQRKRPRRYHYITDVRPVANRDTVCIETDAPSHLFLAGRTLIQTHNSLLYGLYRAWLLKDELVREDATMVRRFGGIPVVETTDPNVSAAATQEAATMAQAVQSGDGAGAATPFGTRLRILGVEGTLPKPLESIKYHDQQMARAFMQMVMELGNTSHGSRALGSTLMDHYALGVLSIAKAVQKTQMQLVRRIVVRNYGANAPLPHIRFRQDDHEDITPTDLVGLIEAGAITVDDDLEAQIRKQSNLVPRNPALTGRLLPTAKPAAVPVPVAATATSREHIHRHDHSASAAATVPTDLIAPAQVDFEALRESHATAVLLLTATWNGVQAALIADLTAQIAAATGVEDVAGVTPMVLGGAALAALLVDVVEHGAQSALGEFEAQGVTIPAPDLTATHAMIAASAAATAIMLSNALGQSASSAAVASWGPDANPSFIADVVQQHLEGLAGATPNYEMTALASRAQNAGRGTVFEHSPTGTHYIASAVLDDHACTACLQDNGRTFATLDEARVIFPGSGQNSDCSGRGRCRCVLVAVVEDSITVA